MNFCYETKPYQFIMQQKDMTMQSINDCIMEACESWESGVLLN